MVLIYIHFLESMVPINGQMVAKSNMIIHISTFSNHGFYLRSVFEKVWFQSISILGGGLGGGEIG